MAMETDTLNNPITVFEKEGGGILYQIKDGKVFFLIIHRIKQDDWSLPKGHVEGNETLQECALRETREETGWQGEIVAQIDTMKYSHHDQKKNKVRNVEVIFFLIRPISEDKALLFSDEVDSTHWIEYGDVLFQKMTYQAQKVILEKAFYYLKKNEK